MSSAVAILDGYAGTQIDVLLGRRDDVVADVPDAVHKSRVATRRLRSLLRTFRPALDLERTEPLRVELKWWAGLLGGARDAEVLRARLLRSLAELDPDDDARAASERIAASLAAEHAAAHAAMVAEIDGARAGALFAELAAWGRRGLPPSTPGRADADGVLPALLARACARVDRALRRAEAASGLDRRVAWHTLRKRAKAARYGAEALTSLAGDPAAALAVGYEAVTEALGELQDAVVAAQRLVAMAVAAEQAGEPTSAYWRLMAVEHHAVAPGEVAGRRALAAIDQRGLRDWLRAVED